MFFRDGLPQNETLLKDLSEKGKLSDYAILHFATQQRLKLWGRARVVEGDIALMERLVDPSYKAKPQRAPMQRHEGGYYIRLAVVDRPGTAATIARRMADEKISLESIMQHGRDRRPHGGDDPRVDKPALVVLITYATTEDAVRRALAAIEQDGVWVEKPQVIRIEKS